MTPPTTQIAAAGSIAVVRHPGSELAAAICRRLLNPTEWSRVRLLTDIIVLYVASSVALFADGGVPTSTANRLMALAFPIITMTIMRARRAPDERLHASLLDMLGYVLGVVSLATMLLISADSLISGISPLRLAPRLWIFGVVYLGTARAMLVMVRRQAMCNKSIATPTVVVGAGMIGSHLVRRLVEEPSYGLRPVAFLDSDPLPLGGPSGDSSVPVLGGTDDLRGVIASTGARHVILAFTAEPDHILVAKVRECESQGVQVSLVPRLYESINERTTLDHVGGLPLLTLHTIDPKGWQFAVKHALDRTFAALGLLLSAPIMLVVALLVRISSPGPTLFRQRRVGRDGREFDVLKFRTMRVPRTVTGFEPADGLAPGGVEGPDRRTRIGCALRDLSLDELPQLINVLRGDMSIVGPRPERPEYVARFARDVSRYEDRHRVKSGITGWAQVHGLRGQTSIADRVEWDNYYIQNWSLRLDVRILALTIAEVLRFRG
ncbi:MAG: exopolysaccharide biosynthesis polyprenyl glycosylphosphotransferase [Solirubrobacteraceae bacterium]